MTREEFIKAQTQLGLTNQQMADELYCSKSAIEKYRGGRLPVPKLVGKIIVFFVALLDEGKVL